MSGLSVPDLVRGVAGHGLPGGRSLELGEPLPPDVWRSLLTSVRHQRIQGLLSAAVADDTVPTTPDQREEAIEAHATAMTQVLMLERVLLDVADALEGADVDFAVIKGLALAHLDYADPALRGTGDIDLVVRAAHLDRAVAAVADAGFTRSWPQLRRGFDRKFGKAVTLRGPGGMWLDLHRTFAVEPLGLLVDNDDLFRQRAAYRLAGRVLPTLPLEERFMAVCYNAALGDVPPRLAALRDVAQLALGPASPSAERVRTLARRWEGEVVLSRAITLAWERFGLQTKTALSRWAHSHVADPVAARRLSTHLGPKKGLATRAREAVRCIDSVPDKIAYLTAIGLPSRAFLARRDVDGYRAWLTRGAGTAMGDER